MFRSLSIAPTNDNMHKRYQSSNTKQPFKDNKMLLSENSFNSKYICLTHNKTCILFCSTCHKDICSFCQKNHRNHQVYNYKEFQPSEKEINLLKKTIKKYCHDYNLLLNEMTFWKKIIDKKLSFFLKNIRIFNSNDDIKFVDNFDIDNACFGDLVKFKKIYSCIIPSNDNKISFNNKVPHDLQRMPLYNSQDFLLSKSVLNELISSNDETNDMNKFISCSSRIINYIVEINKKFQKFLENNRNNRMNNSSLRTKYQFYTYSEKMDDNFKYMTDDNISKYENNKIIEKFIDFKEYYNLNPNNNIKHDDINSNYTPKNTILKSNLKKRIFNNDSLKTSYSSNNLFKSANINFNDNSSIYSKKSITPKIGNDLSKSIDFENTKNKNGNIEFVINGTKTLEGKKYLNKSYSMKNNNRFFRPIKDQDFTNLKNSSFSKNVNFLNNNSSENLVPKINKKINLKKNNFIYEIMQKEKETKKYIHKRLVTKQNNEIQNNSINNNNENKNIQNINIAPLNNSEYKYNTMDYHKNMPKKNNQIKSSLFKMLKYNKNTSLKKDEESKSKFYERIPKITKTTIDDKFLIDGNKPLYIGLDLGDSECKISMVNQNNNEIKLICFKKDSYSVPTIIYFDEFNDNIKIGVDAENSGKNNPSQSAFNLLKFVGIKYDEIIGKKDLWPFKIYKNGNNQRPYIKVDYNGQKEKIFYFEDILSMYIQKLFEQYFQKIILINPLNKRIKLNIQLSLPNYLTYLQKKIIEKIFQNIFSNNRKFNGYYIILEKIRLENPSNISCLYNELRNPESFDKNILSLFIDGCSINLSIINKKRDLYEVKGIESAGFGEEDFTDNYICYCLRNFDENINRKYLQSSLFLYQLRKAIILAKRNFDIIPQTQIELNIPYGSQKNENCQNISFILKKSDYEKSCDEFFKKISLLIKNILSKSKLKEIDIDDIILIGSTAQYSKIKLMLYNIFKNNQKINKILPLSNSFINKEMYNDYLIPIGCSLQIMNNNNILPLKYIFNEISPFSFGIESLDGLTEVVIQKGKRFPCKSKKLIKIMNNKNENIFINILEGDDLSVTNNKFITSVVINKSNFEKSNGKDYIEVIVQLELDCYYNLKCYIIDPKSNNRFECLININVVKN